MALVSLLYHSLGSSIVFIYSVSSVHLCRLFLGWWRLMIRLGFGSWAYMVLLAETRLGMGHGIRYTKAIRSLVDVWNQKRELGIKAGKYDEIELHTSHLPEASNENWIVITLMFCHFIRFPSSSLEKAVAWLYRHMYIYKYNYIWDYGFHLFLPLDPWPYWVFPHSHQAYHFLPALSLISNLLHCLLTFSFILGYTELYT